MLREMAPSTAELDQIAAVERDPDAAGMDLDTWAVAAMTVANLLGGYVGTRCIVAVLSEVEGRRE